jgi:integrase
MAIYRPTYRDKDTGELREAEVYWCDFTYQHRRIRESTGQTKKTLAKSYENRRRRELENAIAGVTAPKSEDRIRDVKSIIESWIKVRTAGKRERTKAYIRERCAHLIEHLGGRLTCDVTEAAVAQYIGKREAEGAAACSINREVFLLSRALRVDRKTAWPELGQSKRPKDPVGKAITDADVLALLDAAGKNRSKYALPFIAIAIYTGFRAGEVRTLRWRQADFMDGWLRSEQSKTAAGEFREVPLLPELKTVLLAHRVWIEKKLGAAPEPEHYVFPFANRGKPVDPERPCTNIASAWWSIRDDAGVSCRLHDLRHTYASRLLEAGNSEAVVRDMIGHVDAKVIQRYTHIRRAAKRDAVLRAFAPKPEAHVKESPKVSPVPTETESNTETANLLPVQ